MSDKIDATLDQITALLSLRNPSPPIPGLARELLEKSAEHIRSLTERLEKAEKDAGRYRWLRDHEATCSWEEGDTEVCNHPGLLDEAVDESITQEGADHE